MRGSGTNLLVNVKDVAATKQFRSIFLESILATDMSKHADIISQTTALPEWAVVW